MILIAYENLKSNLDYMDIEKYRKDIPVLEKLHY